MKNLTLHEIACTVARRLKVSRTDAMLVLAESMSVISQAVGAGRQTKLRFLGTFKVVPRAGGCVNAAAKLRRWESQAADVFLAAPVNGRVAGRELVEIPAHMKVAFKPCRTLKLDVIKLPLPAGWKPRR